MKKFLIAASAAWVLSISATTAVALSEGLFRQVCAAEIERALAAQFGGDAQAAEAGSTKEIELPDGSVAEFPADMADADIERVLAAQFGEPPKYSNGIVLDNCTRNHVDAAILWAAAPAAVITILGALLGGLYATIRVIRLAWRAGD